MCGKRAQALLRGTELLFDRLALRDFTLQQGVFDVQLDEYGDLRAKHVGVGRLHDVIDGAGLVTAEYRLLVLIRRGEEDDRRVSRALAFANHLRGLKP